MAEPGARNPEGPGHSKGGSGGGDAAREGGGNGARADGGNGARAGGAEAEAHQALRIAGELIEPGQERDLSLEVSELFSGRRVEMPLRVRRALEPGPTVFVSAAVHGDELNGTGIVRELAADPSFELARGSLVLVPVVNVLGFDQLSRYLPDRRDLNRSFPGRAAGSMTARYAHTFFQEIVKRCDAGIDLHTAAVRRTNFPNVRADLSKPKVRRLAEAFGCELVVNSKGPKGSLRSAATRAGCPTIILEAGEVWKIEPNVAAIGLRGVRNVLIALGMVEGEPQRPVYQAEVRRTSWTRAGRGGLLRFHAAAGEPVSRRQPLATITDLLGKSQQVIRAPRSGVVLGLTTMPAVKPGDPVCHLAYPEGGVAPIRAALERAPDASLAERLRQDLATNVVVEGHEAR